ncbi:unnamed protein product, partial [Phaeothamnion confervicola]
VAIKVFKTTLNEFSDRSSYVEGDARYSGLRFNKQSRRQMFGIWAEKEFRNLRRLEKAQIPAPVPLAQRQHVLLLSFLGRGGWPAPQLREMHMSAEGWRGAYAQSVELTRRMFGARLIHGDFSEYNIIVFHKVCHAIDFGQSVDLSHPDARELLRRDLAGTRIF